MIFLLGSCSTFSSGYKCPTGKSNVSAKKFRQKTKSKQRPVYGYDSASRTDREDEIVQAELPTEVPAPVASNEPTPLSVEPTELASTIPEESNTPPVELISASVPDKEEKKPVQLPIFQSISKKQTTIDTGEPIPLDGDMAIPTKKVSRKEAKRLAKEDAAQQKILERAQRNRALTTRMISSVDTDRTYENIAKSKSGEMTFYLPSKASREVRKVMASMNENIRFVPLHDVFLDEAKATETLMKVKNLMIKYPEIKASLVGTASWFKASTTYIDENGQTREVLFGKSKAVYDQVLSVEALSPENLEVLRKHGIPLNEHIRVGDLIRARGNAMRMFLINEGIAEDRLGVVMGAFKTYEEDL